LENPKTNWQDVVNLHKQAQLSLKQATVALDEAVIALQEVQKRMTKAGYLLSTTGLRHEASLLDIRDRIAKRLQIWR
jgi:hypothetical protein